LMPPSPQCRRFLASRGEIVAAVSSLVANYLPLTCFRACVYWYFAFLSCFGVSET
jgi:hypothetical protein